MKKITIGLICLFGLFGCSTTGRVAVSGKPFRYELPTVVYEKHEAVVYPAGRHNGM